MSIHVIIMTNNTKYIAIYTIVYNVNFIINYICNLETILENDNKV